MRTKMAFINAFTSILLRLVLAITGIFLPRFFIRAFGSPVNGLVTSINQFVSYLSLVEAGVGAAGMVALYKPIVEKNQQKINAVVSAARQFYLRSGLIFVALAALLTVVYPYVVKSEIQDAGFVRMMIILLCINSIVDYFYLGKYRVLLLADQRGYVISIILIIGTIVMCAVSIGLITVGASALLVKSVTAIVYILRSLAIGIYVKIHYPKLNLREKPDTTALTQRRPALMHQIVSMITFHTDAIVLTLMLPKNALLYVSIYTTYDLVRSGLSGMIDALQEAMTPSFGNLIAHGSAGEVLDSVYSSFEFAAHILVFTIYSCMAVLLYPFIALYSVDFPDHAQYLQYSYVLAFTISGVLFSLRMPTQMLTNAAGHYDQTKWHAVIEGAINMTLSLALVRPLGMIGVLIGTAACFLYRLFQSIVYANRHILTGKTIPRTVLRLLRNGVCSVLMIILGTKLLMPRIHTWLAWFAYAALYAALHGAVLMLMNFLFERKQAIALVRRVVAIARRGRK